MKEYLFEIQDVDSTNPPYVLKNDVDGWKNYGVNYGRSTEYGSIVKSHTVSWTFVKEDAKYLRMKMFNHGVNRRLKLVVKHLKSQLNGAYETEYQGFLDLTQAEVTDVTFSCPLNEGGLFKALENRWSTEYDIPLDEKMDFTGTKIRLSNRLDVTGGSFTIDETDKTIYVMKLDKKNDSDTDLYSDCSGAKLIRDYGNHFTTYDEQNYFFNTGNSRCGLAAVNVDFAFKAKVSLPSGSQAARVCLYLYEVDNSVFTTAWSSYGDLYIQWNTADITHGQIRRWLLAEKYTPAAAAYAETSMAFNGSRSILLSTFGDKHYMLALCCEDSAGVKTVMLNEGYIDVSFDVILNCNKIVQFVEPVKVFKQIVNGINDGAYNIVYDTADFESIVNDGDIRHVLTCGNGLRGYDGTFFSLTTSLSSFCEALYKIYNFKLGIDYDKVTDTYFVRLKEFSHFYNNTPIAPIERVNDFVIRPYREVLYTLIKVGYDTNDGSINGKQDYNSTMTFLTPNTQVEENEWNLVSPYSASIFDIETFLYNNYEKFDDAVDKDTQIFILEIANSSLAELPTSIIEQRWNDVLVVNNNPLTNGGYSFVSYQWYANSLETPLPNGNGQYYNFQGVDIATELSFGNVYFCKVVDVNGNSYVIYFNGQSLGVELDGLHKPMTATAGIDFLSSAYNLYFTPKKMLLRHAREMNCYFNFDLWKWTKFHSAERNEGLVDNGIVERADVKITNDILFKPVILELTSVARRQLIQSIEANRLGYFSVEHAGKTYKAYMANDETTVEYNPMQLQPSDFILLAHKDCVF